MSPDSSVAERANARAYELRHEVTAQKAAIRLRREALRRAAAALAQLEQDCAQRGIRLFYQGEGEPHGQKTTAAEDGPTT